MERVASIMTMIRDDDQAGEQPTSERPVGGRIGIRPILATFRRHRRWLALAVIAVLALTLIAYALAERRFNAGGSVWLDHGLDTVVAPASAAAAQPDRSLSRNTEMRVLTSDDVVGRVVDKLGLANVRGLGQPPGGGVSPNEGRQRAIAALRDGIKVEATGASYAAAVSYASTDPALAAGIVNQTIDQYVELRRSGGVRGQARAQLRGQVDAAHDEVIRADAAVAGYRTATSLIGNQPTAALIRDEISALGAQLAAAQADQAAAETRLGARGGSAASYARLRDLRTQQAQINAGRTALADRPRSDPEVVDADRRLADLSSQIVDESKRASGLVGDARAARGRAAAIAAARDRARAELQASSQASSQLARLEQTAGAARSRYVSLQQRYERLLAAQRAAVGGAYVIAHSPVPTAPDRPDPLAYALSGLLAAAVAAIAVVLGLELLARGFRTRAHVERTLGIPVIGMVPDLAKMPGSHAVGNDPMDHLVADNKTPFSAAFRSIHTGLRLGGGKNSPRSIAVSSALPEEGKTTVAVCLARSAALAGLRVVLVDCDVRRPAASRALAGHVETGLIEVLEGKATVKQALLRDTPSGAWLLAHSSDRAVANDLIGSPAMADLVASLSRDYDLVVLDTAPALALAEARVVAAMADGVLLVARWRRTPVQATRIALDLLNRSGAKVTAAALTLVGR